jgi:ATP-binding cassette subfamily F protein 3
MIQINNICLAFGSQPIFDHFSCTVDQHQRIGLVGRNGSGKSTLLKAIIDPALLDSGSIAIMKGKKIAYMPQDVVFLSELSIIDETCGAFTEYHTLKQEATRLEHLLQTTADHKIMEQYAAVQEKLTVFAPEMLKAHAKKMLMGLGFGANQFDMPVSSLSVGWKMRVVLAKLLLQEADFYLFDEPTNHLDLVAKEWFLDFLKDARFGFMLVCHERYFLDELCNTILELERGIGTVYTGNYSQYLVQKEHALTLLSAAYVQQQKEIKRKQETIERFRASASKAKMAQSMMKALDKVERITLPPSPKDVSFSFPPVQQSGKIVITVKNVSQSFGEKKVFSNVSFEVERGQKVALIAPNGVGKTTLFNVIAGVLPLQQGSIEFGYNVSYAVFAQDQNRALNLQQTILENLKQLCPKASEQTIRSFLGAFLFSNDDVHKKVGVLSGGEKNRVGMVSVLLQNANLLLLDEPTNHLDIPSKEILLKALQEFRGTLLFVSHDRDFINALATNVIELTPTGAYTYHGNYDSYVHQKRAAQQITGNNQEKTPPAHKNKNTVAPLVPQQNAFELNKKSRKLEEKIAKTDAQIKKVQLQFADLVYGTPEFSAAQEKLIALQHDLKTYEAEWEQIQNEIYS